ncbi:MAG: hypothetical protein L0241_00720 [Planctomycetia bacterium]|nr:hypothetical protein [Planctomycetia bacterium]
MGEAMTAPDPRVSSEPDRGWPVRRLLAGAIVGGISGSQSGPVAWDWPRIWPLDWRTDAPGLVMLGVALVVLAVVAFMQFTDERDIARELGRPRRWWIHAGQAVLMTLVMVVGFTFAIFFLLAVAGALLVGFVWLTYGIGPVRGAIVGVAAVGLCVLIGRIPAERTPTEMRKEDTDGQENTR